MSSLNGRALSLLRLTNAMDRMIYDDGTNAFPNSLVMDFSSINKNIECWKMKSLNYIKTEILNA